MAYLSFLMVYLSTRSEGENSTKYYPEFPEWGLINDIYIYIYTYTPKFSTLGRLNIIQLDKLGNFKSENKLKNNDD